MAFPTTDTIGSDNYRGHSASVDNSLLVSIFNKMDNRLNDIVSLIDVKAGISISEAKDLAAKLCKCDSYEDYDIRTASITYASVKEHDALIELAMLIYAKSDQQRILEELPDHECIIYREDYLEENPENEAAFERGAHWAVKEIKLFIRSTWKK